MHVIDLSAIYAFKKRSLPL